MFQRLNPLLVLGYLLALGTSSDEFGVRDSDEHYPMLVSMVLVSVSRPESTLDRESLLHLQPNCFVPELLFAAEAMFPLRE